MARAFQKLVNKYNTTIVQLGAHFHRHPSGMTRLFNLTVKNHILEHIGLDSGTLNPSIVWGYPSEDFLMKVRKLVQSSAHGASPMRIQRTVMHKYIHGLQMSILHTLPVLA